MKRPKSLIPNKTQIFVIVAFLLVVYLIYYDFYVKSPNFDWNDVNIEIHGLLFDIILFGIVLTFYDKVIRKKEEIKRFKFVIEDCRTLSSEFAQTSLRNAIRQLYYLGEKKIEINNCYLPYSDDLFRNKNYEMTNLNYSNLDSTGFGNVNFYDTYFRRSIITSSSFIDCNLRKANFNNAFLMNTSFNNCKLGGATFEGAIVNNHLFIEDLYDNNFKNDIDNELITNFTISLLVWNKIDLENSFHAPLKKYFNTDLFEIISKEELKSRKGK